MVKPVHQLIKQALQYRFLTRSQLSELQQAQAIIESVAEHAKDTGNAFLADQLFNVLAQLDDVIDDREEARQRYLAENRAP
jgi:phage shock protein A